MVRLPLTKYISLYLVVALFIISIVPRAEAGFSPSEIIALAQAERSVDIENIQKVLEVKAVGERLRQLGLAKDEIQTRLAQLSDQQIHQVAQQLDNIKLGQGDAGTAIIVILLILILIVVVLKVTGHKVMITK